MHSDKMQVLFSSAEDLYKNAEKETMRSQEDVVTHMLCYNSRQAIINYLHGFLLKYNVGPVEPITMASLLEQCKDIDGRFGLADITPINCRFETHDRDYCLEREQVDRCFESATQVRNIVMSDAPGY